MIESIIHRHRKDQTITVDQPFSRITRRVRVSNRAQIHPLAVVQQVVAIWGLTCQFTGRASSRSKTWISCAGIRTPRLVINIVVWLKEKRMRKFVRCRLPHKPCKTKERIGRVIPLQMLHLPLRTTRKLLNNLQRRNRVVHNSLARCDKKSTWTRIWIWRSVWTDRSTTKHDQKFAEISKMINDYIL